MDEEIVRILADMIRDVHKGTSASNEKMADTLVKFAEQVTGILEVANAAIKLIYERTLQLDERIRRLEK